MKYVFPTLLFFSIGAIMFVAPFYIAYEVLPDEWGLPSSDYWWAFPAFCGLLTSFTLGSALMLSAFAAFIDVNTGEGR